MKKHTIIHLLAVLTTTAMVTPEYAYGQIVDYEKLESLYGQPITINATGLPQRAIFRDHSRPHLRRHARQQLLDFCVSHQFPRGILLGEEPANTV